MLRLLNLPGHSRRLDTRDSRCNTATMVADLRQQRSASLEGSGRAKEAWDNFHLRQARELTEEAGARRLGESLSELLPEVRDELVVSVIEESELLGFWLAWWRAGGFSGLEAAGWNRATVFRKLRRFRSTFGVHPDDYDPGWVTLDLPQVWSAALKSRLAPDPDLGL